MTKKKVGVVLEYWPRQGAYKIAKITGAAIARFPHSGHWPELRRVGDHISEESATALAVTHDVTTVLGK